MQLFLKAKFYSTHLGSAAQDTLQKLEKRKEKRALLATEKMVVASSFTVHTLLILGVPSCHRLLFMKFAWRRLIPIENHASRRFFPCRGGISTT